MRYPSTFKQERQYMFILLTTRFVRYIFFCWVFFWVTTRQSLDDSWKILYISMNSVPCSLDLAIMTFCASLSLDAVSGSVTHFTFSHFFQSMLYLFSLLSPAAFSFKINPVVTRCFSFFFLITWPKKDCL